MSNARWLLADVGGTNTRIAIREHGSALREFHRISRLKNSEYDSLAQLLTHSLADLGAGKRPTHAVFAVAAPIRGSRVRLMNIDWEFEITELRDELGLDTLTVINDFHAQALALRVLCDVDRVSIGGGRAIEGKPMAVLGPGTGLGVAGLTPVANDYAVVTGEGGHMTLAAANDFEAGLLAEIRRRTGHCSAERVLSGTGLGLLHDVLHGEACVPAHELGARANAGDIGAAKTFRVFFDFLGTVASDVALTLGAMGGTYIAGGIAPANQRLFLDSGFRARFIDKGRYRAYLDKIPTWLVTADTPALLGLASYASLQ